MKNFLKSALPFRLLAGILSLTLIMGGLVLPLGAKSDDSGADTDYTTFTTDPDTDALTASFPAFGENDRESKVYLPCKDLSGLLIAPTDMIRFTNEVTYGGKTYTAFTPSTGSDLVMLYENTETSDDVFGTSPESEPVILMTEDGAEKARALLTATEFAHARMSFTTRGEDQYAPFDPTDEYAFLLNFDTKAAEGVTFTYEQLAYARYYTVQGFERDDCLGVNVANIYVLGDALYYADVRDPINGALYGASLPAATDTFTLYRLNEEQEEQAALLIDRTDASDLSASVFSWTNETLYGFSMDMEDAEGAAYVSVILFGILLPLVPLIMGLCLPHTRKKRNRRWYWMAAAGGAWMALGIGLLIILILTL